MITYMELSSLCYDLGFSASALYTASNCARQHYRKATIPKKNGDTRELTVPDSFLKTIQKRIAERLLVYEEISPYATAYRYGGSTYKNAAPHLQSEQILKLDIRQFFDHITYAQVKNACFPKNRYSEKNRVLLTLICMYNDTLPQGAPSSPIISNIIMKDFDNTVGAWCAEKRIRYTRYCDDLTFSGSFQAPELISFVKDELKKMGFFLNSKKTVLARNGQKMIVTGITVNERLNTPSAYRKKLRQELFYCKKYGVSSHIKHQNIPFGETEYIRKLLGKVNYALSVHPKDAEMQSYKSWLKETLLKKQ